MNVILDIDKQKRSKDPKKETMKTCHWNEYQKTAFLITNKINNHFYWNRKFPLVGSVD